MVLRAIGSADPVCTFCKQPAGHAPALLQACAAVGKEPKIRAGCQERVVLDHLSGLNCIAIACLLLSVQAVDEQAGQGIHQLAQPPADAVYA